MADWKKRLLRVKQKADQNLGRAEKTEVLTDELHREEKWVEQVKTVCHNTHKRVKACLHETQADKERKLRKHPDYLLATHFAEASQSLVTIKEDTLMGKLMMTCGQVQGKLANECVEYESQVEAGVLASLNTLCEQDIPAIQRTKKNLNKMVLDMDLLKNKYHSALKQQSTGNLPQVKVEAIKEELEDAQSKVQSCKDLLSTEMYKFAASEQEYSRFLLNFVEAQANYHRNALQHLETIIPHMKEECDCSQQMPVYGTALEDHLSRTGREIATVIEDCIATLWEFGREEEGLFRIAGSASKVKKLKAAFDAGLVDMEEFLNDVHCIAGALKLYLRELPEPLMTYKLYDEWMAAAHLDHEERMQNLWTLCSSLPKQNYDNLRYLIKFLAKLSESSEMTKMSPTNIAIVMGPNLLWPEDEGGPSVLTTTTQSAIVENLISHADYFFPGEIHYGLSSSSSDKGTPPGTLNAPPAGLQQANKANNNMYPNLEEMSINTAPSLSPSGSDHNFKVSEGQLGQGMSPLTLRKNKRAAPAPPGNKPTMRPSNAPPPLANLDKPATMDKPPHLSPGAQRSGSTSEQGQRSPHPPDRPSAPPPAPPKPTSPGVTVTYDPNTGSNASPRPKPAMHDKPGSGTDQSSDLSNGSAAYDNMPSLPYGTKPFEPTPVATDDFVHVGDASDSATAKSNSLPRNVSSSPQNSPRSNSLPKNVSKPPRPPRPVTMLSKPDNDSSNTENDENSSALLGRKPSASEETHL